MNAPVYLDNNATTRVDPRVLAEMLPYFTEHFGNAASRNHAFGWAAEKAADNARDQVGALLGASGKEIVWTSGATESNNLALKGAAQFYKERGKHLITVKTEHKATLDTMRELERQGFEVTYLDVQENGLIDMNAFQAALRPDTILVSVMFVNNEIGVIQPIAEIAEITRSKGIIFHVDSAQATGKVEIDLQALKVDLMSFSAHKTYGPKGMGALFVRKKPRIRLEAQIHGGGHERGMRSGTLNVPGIVGFGKACELCRLEMEEDTQRISKLRDKLETELLKVEEAYVNGSREHRLPHVSNISFKHVEGEGLLMGFNKNIALSSGSACTSASLEPSYVLKALGLGDDLAHSSIRFSLGRFTTDEQIQYTIDHVTTAVNKLRDMSPLWEMFKQGIDLSTIEWAAH